MATFDLTDITANLPSVQFESALTEEQYAENYLRNKCHSLLYNACAQSVYFVSSLNEFRENRLLVLHPNDKKLSNKLLKDMQAKEPLLVGIIGFGRLGSRLANFLVRGSGLMPQELKISTRRPELASDLTARGCICVFDNAKVASSVHLLFLCCPPAALPSVADEIRDHLSPRTIVYSYVTGYRERKLRQLLDHEALICPAFSCRPALASVWPMSAEMVDLMMRPATAMAACPVAPPASSQDEEDCDNEPGAFLRTDPKLITLWIYSLANLCTLKRHTVDETLAIVNHICVRSAIKPARPTGEDDDEKQLLNEAAAAEAEAAAAALLLQPRDLIRGLDASDEHLPLFDLTEISQQATFLDDRLRRDAALRRSFTDRFCQRLGAACTKLKFHSG
uniref:F420_oxidored domain-containing protein n=1 Tax=Macrostomum lignano TaxID=282301 RepID=A0A1I8G679_9PLAT